MSEQREARPVQIFVPALVSCVIALAHSIHARGVRRTLLFALLGTSLPGLAEYVAINKLKLLKHHSRPQIENVPLSAVLGWYNIGYTSFALAEGLLTKGGEKPNLLLIAGATAAIATSLDLVLDVLGLEEGMWEWRDGGPYAAEVVGSNGKHGIPLGNFAGWIGLTGSVSLLYQAIGKSWTAEGAANTTLSQRWASMMMLPYYLNATSWAIRHRRYRFIAYAALVPIVLLLAWRRRNPEG